LRIGNATEKWNPRAPQSEWEVLTADFADDADEEKEICAISAICGCAAHSALERLFSGIQFGLDDWGNCRLPVTERHDDNSPAIHGWVKGKATA